MRKRLTAWLFSMLMVHVAGRRPPNFIVGADDPAGAYLRRYAHGRKGLDLDTYTLKLQAVGATSTTALTRTQYDQLLAALHQLPDRQRKAT